MTPTLISALLALYIVGLATIVFITWAADYMWERTSPFSLSETILGHVRDASSWAFVIGGVLLTGFATYVLAFAL